MGHETRGEKAAALLFTVTVVALGMGGCSQPANPSAVQPPQQPQVLAATQPIPAAVPIAVRGDAVSTEVPLEEDGGTYVVPVTINGTISLKFTIDSGASDVSLPSDVVSTLIRSGTITKEDYIGDKTRWFWFGDHGNVFLPGVDRSA